MILTTNKLISVATTISFFQNFVILVGAARVLSVLFLEIDCSQADMIRNACYKVEKYVKGSKYCEAAAKYYKYDISIGEEDKKQARLLRGTYNLNKTALRRELKAYQQV